MLQYLVIESTALAAEAFSSDAEATFLEAEVTFFSPWSVAAFEAPGVKEETPRVEFRADAGIEMEDDEISR
jgi:hypothetical protein